MPVYKGIRKYTQEYASILRYTQIHTGINQYTQVYTSIHSEKMKLYTSMQPLV